MSRLAYLVARCVWWAILWFMRRTPVKRLRRRTWEVWPEPWRSRVRRSIVSQDRWARRFGLSVITGVVAFVIGCLAVSSAVYATMRLQESGVLSMPEEIKERIPE